MFSRLIFSRYLLPDLYFLCCSIPLFSLDLGERLIKYLCNTIILYKGTVNHSMYPEEINVVEMIENRGIENVVS